MPSLSRRRTAWITLFLNHMDAWQVALTIATLPLLIHHAIRWETAVLLIAIGVGYWFAFALNDYYDAPIDAIDTHKARHNYFVYAAQQKRRLLPLSFLILTCLLAAFAQFGLLGILLFAICCFIMWAYSAPPLRLKSRPGLDLLTHTFFVQTFPYLICLWLIGATWTTLDVVLLWILLLASLTAQLEQQVRDFAIDRQVERNFTIWIGRSQTICALKIGTAVCILIALINVLNGTIPWFIMPFGLIGLPALLHRFWRSDSKSRSEKLVLLSTTAGFLYTGGLLLYFLLA